MRVRLGIALMLVLAVGSMAGARVVMKPVGSSGESANLLRDPDGWRAYGAGFGRDAAVRHGGKASIRCESSTTDEMRGASQVVELNQQVVHPLNASGWSRAQGVSDGEEDGYAVYLDIEYMDGSFLYRQIAPFRTGTHGWERAEVTIVPARPVRRALFYALFRKHSGKAWFDDLRLTESRTPHGTVFFEGALVEKPVALAALPGRREFATADGLSISLSEEGTVAAGAAGALKLGAGGGFYARDAAAKTAFQAPDKLRWTPVKTRKAESFSGEIGELGLRLTGEVSALPDRIAVTGSVKDLRNRDRAITVGFALPVAPGGCSWGRDLYQTDKVIPGMEYQDIIPCQAGATGAISRYPWAALSKSGESLSLAIPLDQPRVYRLTYNSDAGLYAVSFDLGLSPDGPKRGEADFSFVIYRTPRWGYRGAVKKYYQLYPDFFIKRVAREGIWMPFTDIAKVPHPEDFHFAFHEGDNNVAWDNAHDVYAFRYTEPMSYWMPMAKEIARTKRAALDQIERHLASGDAGQKRWAMATKLCVIEDADGKPAVTYQEQPWCDGALFLLNSNPAIPETDALKVNRAHLAWNPEVIKTLYPKGGTVQLDGEYLDSLEMAGYMLNFRREHFRWSGTPLTFDNKTRRPVIMGIFSTYDFTRRIAEDLHARGKLTMANAALWSYAFPAHLLDVMGTEINSAPNGKFVSPTDAEMSFRRALCYQKPYVFLQNTDFKSFGPERVEKYFQYCLFFGMFPGFFSANASTECYFENPKLYERDRPLFMRYLPVIQQIAAAGWEPVTMARAENPAVKVERFGPDAKGALFFTARNDSGKAVDTALLLDAALKYHAAGARKLPAGGALTVSSSGRIAFSLAPGEVAVVGLSGAVGLE